LQARLASLPEAELNRLTREGAAWSEDQAAGFAMIESEAMFSE
jgi:hypothetical protein